MKSIAQIEAQKEKIYNVIDSMYLRTDFETWKKRTKLVMKIGWDFIENIATYERKRGNYLEVAVPSDNLYPKEVYCKPIKR